MKRHLTMLLTLVAVASLTAANVHSELEPQNYLEYQVSHSGVRFTGRASIETIDLSSNDERLELEVVVNPSRFNSNNLMRDGFASATVFETKIYPRIVFTASSDFTAFKTEQFELAGTLYMHGVAKHVVIPLRLEQDEQTVTATGTFVVKLSDYNMTRPQVGEQWVEDEVSVKFSITTRLDGAVL